MPELTNVAQDPQPTRRERRRLEIRERIVHTAFSLFENKGYETTTVTEIAEQADIAYGTFFKHFPTKLDLLREVSDLALSSLFDDVAAVDRRKASFPANLVDLFETTANSAIKMGPETRGLINAMMATSVPETSRKHDQRIRQAFQNFLRDGLATGSIRQETDLETMTEVVVGSWYSIFLSWVRSDTYPLQERASSVARFLANTLAVR